jgi:ubiquinone/menaquinone biosynthesis C-methylase UbiE
MANQTVERGKPADYGQEIVKRRARITASNVSLSGKLVLDFGSGNGAQTIELLEHGCKVVACDIDQNDLNTLTEYLKNNSITSASTVLYGGMNLPFSNNYFDVVVSYAVLEHVPDESTSLQEIHRVLKPDGELVISVPNKWWIFETHGARLPLLPWNRVPFFSWLPRAIHGRFARARIYRKGDLAKLLETHGFKVLDTCQMMAPMDVVKSPGMQNMLRATIFRGDRSIFPFLSTEIFMHCRKL